MEERTGGNLMYFMKTLSFSISLLSIVLVTILVSILFFNNIYAMNVVRDQVIKSYRELLPRYVEKQDDNLADIQNYLIRTLNHTAENADIRTFNSRDRSSDEYYLAASNLFIKLSRDIITYSYADILFVYSANNGGLVSYASSSANRDLDIDDNLKNLVQAQSATFLSSRWEVTLFDGVPGLLCMSTDGDGSYMGAWVDMTRLLNGDTASLESGRGMIAISGEGRTYVGTPNLPDLKRMVERARIFFDGAPQSITTPNSTLGYMLIVEKSTKSNLYYVEAIEERTLMSSLPTFQNMIYLLPVAIFVVFLIYFAYLQRIIVQPMHSLTRGMSALGRGNVRIKLPETGADEIRFVIRSFNNMATQIETLRIENYENQLQAQQLDLEAKKAELRSMQMQINPHFFANSLNIIYSLSAIRDYQSIQKMALLLSRYFRYIMASGSGSTEMRKEAAFIGDYLEIQKLRFTKRLQYSLQVAENCEDVLIPPLTIQPFVENAIVHGFKDAVNALQIEVSIVREDECCHIRILDNGRGFSEEQLAAFQDPLWLKRAAASHIGIWNVQTRLGMSYGSDASLTLGNRPEGGASVDILIPAPLPEPELILPPPDDDTDDGKTNDNPMTILATRPIRTP